MVRIIEGLLFIMVGVGLGKICVLIYCIVYLLDEKDVLFYNILVIMFINKVVKEMKVCVEYFVGEEV